MEQNELNTEKMVDTHSSKIYRDIHCYEGIYRMFKSGKIVSMRPSYPDPQPDKNNKVELFDSKGVGTKFDIDRLVFKTWRTRFYTFLKVNNRNPFGHHVDGLNQDGTFVPSETDWDEEWSIGRDNTIIDRTIVQILTR